MWRAFWSFNADLLVHPVIRAIVEKPSITATGPSRLTRLALTTTYGIVVQSSGVLQLRKHVPKASRDARKGINGNNSYGR